MSSLLQQTTEQYFLQQFGLTISALLQPISSEQPSGSSLRNTPLYSAIKKARHQDDPSVPMGAWEYELKRADWNEVSTLCLQGLQQSKDMQLAAWLLEAQINQQGLRGIAPCLQFMQQLCSQFWADIYPPAEQGDVEYRVNIIRWLAEKLLPALHLIPLIDDGDKGTYNWFHWEQAQRNEQLKANASTRNPPPIEGVSWPELSLRISATPTERYQALQQYLLDALQAISELSQTLDQLCGEAAPSMSSMANLLQQMQSFFDAELFKRGVRTPVVSAPSAPVLALVPSAANDAALNPPFNAQVLSDKKTARTRAEAYATLAETAEFLIQLEPHSPVPYLVKRATEWGNLNTVELYEELFLRLNGQMNIFEILGLERTATAK